MASENVVYKNRLDLPRLGKGEFSTTIITKELYTEKIENQNNDTISFDEFLEVWSFITDKIKQQVCTNALGVQFPFYLGDVKVNYLPYKIPIIDDTLSQKVGINVPDLYLNSKGKRASIVWERKAARKFNRMLNIYVFEPMQATFRDAVKKALTLTPDLFRVGKLKTKNLIR